MSKILNSWRRIFSNGSEEDQSILYPHKLEMIGGKLICLDLIPNGSTIISGGIGNDVEFELDLIKKKNVLVVGIDPTNTAEQFIENRKLNDQLLQNRYVYLKKALNDTNSPIKLFYGENEWMSSVSSQHRDAAQGNFFVCEAVTIEDLLNSYTNVSYLKIDIEGAEYNILNKLEHLSIPQVSIEFHHHCSTEYTLPETISLIQKIEKMGYDAIDYGSYHGRGRKIPMYAAKWSDLNCELLFIKK
jgi:FkbM family methyltransferase